MACELCSVKVRKWLERVPGVSEARIDDSGKTATVSFDADRTSPAALVRATAEVGFPASIRK